MSATPAPIAGAAVALRLFLPFAFGYFLSYVFRSVNAVIADDLARAIGADAGALGLLTSAYFAAFAAFQIPLGILLDRFGPRRVEAALLAVAALGAFLFAAADGLAGMTLARALIGLGVSGCLMGAFKNAILWWPARRLPLVNGLILASGGLGALAATTPIAALVAATDWRFAIDLLGGLTLAGAAYILLAVPEAPRHGQPGSLAEQLRGVRQVFMSALFWRLSPVAVAVQSVFLSYQGLWAAAWFRDVDGLPPEAVAQYLQAIPLAMIAGFAFTGALAERLGRFGVKPFTAAAGCMALFLVDVASLLLPGPGAPLVQWGLFGFLATASMLTYPALAQAFPPALSGRVITALNLLAFVGAFAAQAGVGAILDLFRAGAGSDPAGHRLALGLLLAICAAAFAWSLWPRRQAPTV